MHSSSVHNYVAEKFIDKGKRSLVYLVSRRHSTGEAKKYALKRYFLENSRCIGRVLSERKVLEMISRKSPFLPTLEDAFWMGTSAALVMTAGSGINLYNLISTKRRMPEESARFYAAEILCGLEHLHDLKIVHMDIKPLNILLTISGHVMITDFDHCLDISSGPVSHPLECLGTLLYSSPEVASVEIIDEKADIWSWASVLVEMVDEIVRNPDLATDELQALARKGEIEMRSYNSYSEALKCLVSSCFQVDSSRRPSIRNLKAHAFFKDINWQEAESCQLTPPFKLTELAIAVRNKSIGPYNSMVLDNLFVSPMIDLRQRIDFGDGSFTFLFFRQNKKELLKAGLTESKIAELFSKFSYSSPDNEVPPAEFQSRI